MMGHPDLEHLHRSCTNSYRRQLSSTKTSVTRLSLVCTLIRKICTGRAPAIVDKNSCYTAFTCVHPNLEHMHRSCTNSYRRRLSSTKQLLRNFHLRACNLEIASRFLGKWHRARFCDCQDAHRGPRDPVLIWIVCMQSEITSRFLGKWHHARFCDCQGAHRGPR